MTWILLFWLNTPTSYQYHIHSEYSSIEECRVKAEYYDKIFKQVGSSLIGTCKKEQFTKRLNENNKLVYRKEVVR